MHEWAVAAPWWWEGAETVMGTRRMGRGRMEKGSGRKENEREIKGNEREMKGKGKGKGKERDAGAMYRTSNAASKGALITHF